jgi:hypothetical protein
MPLNSLPKTVFYREFAEIFYFANFTYLSPVTGGYGITLGGLVSP